MTSSRKKKRVRAMMEELGINYTRALKLLNDEIAAEQDADTPLDEFPPSEDSLLSDTDRPITDIGFSDRPSS